MPHDQERAVLVNTMPKSGTNLVTGILGQLEGLKFRELPLNRRLGFHPETVLRRERDTWCLAGVDQPRVVPLTLVKRVLGRLNKGEYTAGHLPYCAELDEYLSETGLRMVFVARDPRDCMVSQVFHVLERRRHFLHDEYMGATDFEGALRLALYGVRDEKGRTVAKGIREKVNLVLGWLGSSNATVIYFEDLAGSIEFEERRKIDAIRTVAGAAGMGINAEDAKDVGQRAFGTGNTFRRGQAGVWREYMSEEVAMLICGEMEEQLRALGYLGD
jgi:hypothetical protein